MGRIVLLAAVVTITACSSIGVREVSREHWYAVATRNVLNSDDVSEITRNILRRYSLLDSYRTDPVGAIRVLQEDLAKGRNRDLCVAIAELGFLQTGRVSAFDERAVGTVLRYSYAYLFDPGLEPPTDIFDAQFRNACDLYNEAVAEILRRTHRDELEEGGPYRLNWYGGSTSYDVGEYRLAFELMTFEEILVAYDYRVEGLPRPDARRGLGVPCILKRRWARDAVARTAKDVNLLYLPEKLAFTVTCVIRFPGDASILDERQAPGTIDLLDPMEHATITIGPREVPIEVDHITPVAMVLAGKSALAGVDAMLHADKYLSYGGLYMFQPYRPGKIPILFVHGLASDPATWLPLFADLVADETIRSRCQFLFYFYPSGQPVLQSSAQLRRALKESYDLSDPNDEDPAADYALVCGHSMGGVLTRSLVIDPQARLWDAGFKKPFTSVKGDPEVVEQLREMFFFESLPYIRRAIFFASPHRGSPKAHLGIAQWASGFVQRTVSSKLKKAARTAEPRVTWARATSVQSLQEKGNPIAQAMAEEKINARVIYHSVMGDNKGAGRTDGTDGFVPYASSHLDGAASELIVHSGHSVQQTPEAAREAKRIILEHIAAYDAERAGKK